MEYRTLGGTGVKVSPFCLGAMMFGAWGNPDHEDSIRIIHRALDAGINFVDTADVYSRGRVRGDRRQGAQGPARRGRAGDEGRTARWATTPTSAATRAAGSCARSSASLRRLGTDWIDLYQIHRPDPDTDHRRDARRAHRPRPRRQGALHRARRRIPPSEIVEAQWTAERRGRERFVCEQPPYSMLVRGIEAEVLPVCQAVRHGRDPVGPARGRLAHRHAGGKGQEAPQSTRAERLPGAVSTSRCPRTSASSKPPRRSPARRRGRSDADRAWRSPSCSAIPR